MSTLMTGRLGTGFENGFEKHIHEIIAMDILSSPKLRGIDDPPPLNEKYKWGNTVVKP